MVTNEIRIMSSMATRRLLADLVAAYGHASPGHPVSVESVGGVEAAKRIAAGEPFDIVVLAGGALELLSAQGHIVAGSRVDLVRSPMAVAVRSGATRPIIASEDDVKQAVLTAGRIGYSTGPSGDHLLGLLDRWGIAGALKDRLVQARPGVPVGSLVAGGDVALGFQQLSELQHVKGIDVLGLLPDAIQGTTTFAAGVTRVSSRQDGARAVLAFMASPAVDAIKRQNGMELA
jgi:molybdate transport system substrate-binding protein